MEKITNYTLLITLIALILAIIYGNETIITITSALFFIPLVIRFIIQLDKAKNYRTNDKKQTNIENRIVDIEEEQDFTSKKLKDDFDFHQVKKNKPFITGMFDNNTIDLFPNNNEEIHQSYSYDYIGMNDFDNMNNDFQNDSIDDSKIN